MKKRQWIFGILIFLVLFFSVYLLESWITTEWKKLSDGAVQLQLQDENVRKEISKRTGILPDWTAIREYLYCDLLKVGTPKKIVEEGLSNIGPFELDRSGVTYHIYFKERYTAGNLSPFIIYYDQNDKIELSGASEGNYGPRAKCEMK